MAKKSAQEWLRSPADTDSTGATVATDAGNVSTNSQTALFPSSLLCFLQFLIDSVTITDSTYEPRPPLYPNQTGINESTRIPSTSGDHSLCICVCACACVYVCICICVCTCVHACVHTCMHAQIGISLSVCLSVCLLVCPSVCLSVCLHKYINTYILDSIKACLLI